ncbi:MAG: hypothetical protein FJ263_02935 [Planctomycetes bacterium]|nr:hypothetical protein [Planctomycetota bacterium]
MAKREYTSYQKKAISNYYQNLDQIALQRLQELVTELYLADTDKKRDRLWEQVQRAMKNLNVQPAIAEHILKTKDVQVLAKNLQDWLKKK